MPILGDYHMHTPRCKHADGPLEAYAEQALHLGLQEIGFSDHSPLPNGMGSNVRMDPGELGAYVADVQEGKAYLWRNYLVDNCSVTIVTVEHTGRRAVRLYNDTSFMPAQPVDPLTASLREVDRATKR